MSPKREREREREGGASCSFNVRMPFFLSKPRHEVKLNLPPLVPATPFVPTTLFYPTDILRAGITLILALKITVGSLRSASEVMVELHLTLSALAIGFYPL